MHGCGTRWLKRLSHTARRCPAGAHYRRVLPCFVRPFSHGDCLLSRVTRRGSVSSPVNTALERTQCEGRLGQSKADSVAREICATHAAPDSIAPSPKRPKRVQKDAEGREYCELAIVTTRNRQSSLTEVVIFLMTKSLWAVTGRITAATTFL